MKRASLVGRLATALLVGLWLCVAAQAGSPVTIEGQGNTTVVFEAGLGDTREVWSKVQAPIADHCARTVSYTRSGYGLLHRADSPRDAEHIVAELRETLSSQGLSPPYVLVGHSLGGLYMQYYARRYPGEVKGLLLVDSTHWEQMQRMQKEAPSMYRVLRVSSLLMNPVMRSELSGSRLAGEQVARLAAPVSVPTIVLSSTRAGMGENAAFRELEAQLQREIAAAYATRRQEFVPDSGHYIQRDQPRAVITAARELAGCG